RRLIGISGRARCRAILGRRAHAVREGQVFVGRGILWERRKPRIECKAAAGKASRLPPLPQEAEKLRKKTGRRMAGPWGALLALPSPLALSRKRERRSRCRAVIASKDSSRT